VVVLATGGTIAGTAARPDDHVGYTAGQVGAADLLRAVPSLSGLPIEAEQVAQVDSRNMGTAVWQRLCARAAAHLARPEVGGVVVTHGTDTLEETAHLLQRVLAPTKPLVLTAAMRPATAVSADGPQNLADAVAVARAPGGAGVWVAVQGQVFSADAVSKRHPYRVQAFDGGERGAHAVVEQGSVRWLHRPAETGPALPGALAAIGRADPVAWPRVELVFNHAGADGELARAAVAAGAHGLVVAGTGNGTLSDALTDALLDLRQQGVAVWRCSRCLDGVVVDPAPPGPGTLAAVPLSPYKARIEMQLRLLCGSPV
jgi:L-asparaginase